MGRKITLLILVFLLSSLSPLFAHEQDINSKQKQELETVIERIEISPDPDSIKDLGRPEITTGSEGSRHSSADSSIGIFTDSGLLLEHYIPENLRKLRTDLSIVLIKPETGLWDARVQFTEDTNVKVRSIIPPSGLLLQGKDSDLENASQLDFVTSRHNVPLAMIVDRVLWTQSSDDLFEVRISGWKDNELNRLDTLEMDIGGSLSNLASRNLANYWSPEPGIHLGTINNLQISDLAASPQISFISESPVLLTSNDMVRSHTEANDVESVFISGLNGSGQLVAVADTGIDHDHGDFGNRIAQRIDVAGDGSTADTNDGHGTHVACTVLGSGFRTSSYEGVAPQAELYMQAMEDDSSGSLAGPGIYSLLNSAYSSGGSRIHTNSWGAYNSGGEYSTQSEDADDRTSTWDQYWSFEGMTVLFAAGNERDDGVSPPGTAKNVITVGGHVNRYGSADEMYYWSSRGPTDDGRIKPDIVAPGDYVRSCRAQEASEAPNNLNNQWYVEYSGTSMATPAAAGASALVREYLMEIAERPAPQGALVKALLILGAEDMGTRDIPNFDEGWGRLDLVNSLVPDGDVGIFVDDRSRLSSGQEAQYNFDVTRSGDPLKVVLAWSDYPGSTFSSTQLRNDLNLEVTSPNGDVTYFGNDFSNGRSTTEGDRDNKNNVEVVLIDSASVGIWNVKVKDFSHGGSRTYQPFSIAVRGVNVNDLLPDPAFISNSFEISTPIPQVGEETDFSISMINLGTGSFPEVFVSAYVNSNIIGTKTVGMSPAEDVELEWSWTPHIDEKGDCLIRIEIDPNDNLEEINEDNNVLEASVQVSSPGILASSDSPSVSLGDASDTTTRWTITMTNLALFETNATISVSEPVRTIDSEHFDWFTSFDQIYVNLGPSASTTVNLTLVHPAPPEPGTYFMLITTTDVEFDVESQLMLFFNVPVLAQPEIGIPYELIPVDPFGKTELSADITNRGNGAQTYDLELIEPAGWDLGFNELGPIPGSDEKGWPNFGSTGTMAIDNSIPIDITVTPPGVSIPEGSQFNAQLLVKSRVSSEVWTYDLPLSVSAFDSIAFMPASGEGGGEIEADALHEISIELTNQGNRDLNLTPVERTIPGGWSIPGGIGNISVQTGASSTLKFSIQGNGRAIGGLLEIRLLHEDGTFFDWNTTITSISSAAPSISFDSIVFVNGTSVVSSDNPLGLGAHPIGEPGFDLSWKVTNEGSSSWGPDASMILPNSDWKSSCSMNPTIITPGNIATIWCTIVIPESEQAGAEPEVTLVLSGEGVEIRDTFSLLVQTVNEVQWTLKNFEEAHEGISTNLYFELFNSGNSVISNRLTVDGPSGWNLRILDGILVTLQPGETRSVQVSFVPDSGDEGTVTMMLADTENIDGHKTSISVEVKGDPTNEKNFPWGLISGILLFSAFIATGAFYFFQNNTLMKERELDPTSSQDPKERKSETPLEIENSRNKDKGLESFSQYPGWLWDPENEEWVPDTEN